MKLKRIICYTQSQLMEEGLPTNELGEWDKAEKDLLAS